MWFRGWNICYEEGADTNQGAAGSSEGGDPCVDSVQSPQSASSSRSRRNSCQGNQSCIELFEFGSGIWSEIFFFEENIVGKVLLCYFILYIYIKKKNKMTAGGTQEQEKLNLS
jgi:hypothetical protein